MRSFVFVFISFVTAIRAAAKGRSPCGDLTVCAVQKCLDGEAVNKAVTTSTKATLFGAIVEKFDLVCIATKCTNACSACEQCQYAIEQMSALAQGEPTSGLCPKLEACVQSCLDAGVLAKILSCVADRCNVHCYDGDCPSCKTMSRRMFTIICQQTNMLNLSHIKYAGTCPRLFNDLADEYVARKRRVAV